MFNLGLVPRIHTVPVHLRLLPINLYVVPRNLALLDLLRLAIRLSLVDLLRIALVGLINLLRIPLVLTPVDLSLLATIGLDLLLIAICSLLVNRRLSLVDLLRLPISLAVSLLLIRHRLRPIDLYVVARNLTLLQTLSTVSLLPIRRLLVNLSLLPIAIRLSLRIHLGLGLIGLLLVTLRLLVGLNLRGFLAVAVSLGVDNRLVHLRPVALSLRLRIQRGLVYLRLVRARPVHLGVSLRLVRSLSVHLRFRLVRPVEALGNRRPSRSRRKHIRPIAALAFAVLLLGLGLAGLLALFFPLQLLRVPLGLRVLLGGLHLLALGGLAVAFEVVGDAVTIGVAQPVDVLVPEFPVAGVEDAVAVQVERVDAGAVDTLFQFAAFLGVLGAELFVVQGAFDQAVQQRPALVLGQFVELGPGFRVVAQMGEDRLGHRPAFRAVELTLLRRDLLLAELRLVARRDVVVRSVDARRTGRLTSAGAKTQQPPEY